MTVNCKFVAKTQRKLMVCYNAMWGSLDSIHEFEM